MQQTAGDAFRKFIFAVLSTIIGGLIVYAYQDDFRAFIGKQDNTEKEFWEAKAEAERERLKRIEAEKKVEEERAKKASLPPDTKKDPYGQLSGTDNGISVTVHHHNFDKHLSNRITVTLGGITKTLTKDFKEETFLLPQEGRYSYLIEAVIYFDETNVGHTGEHKGSGSGWIDLSDGKTIHIKFDYGGFHPFTVILE